MIVTPVHTTRPVRSVTKPHSNLNDYYGEESQRQHTINGLFDRVAPDYDWISQMLSFGTGKRHRMRTLHQAGLSAGMHVLDVACGPGTVSLCAKNLVKPNGNVVGVDPSRRMLEEAQKNGLTCLGQGIAERLPFHNSTFDFVTMGYALRHVSNLESTFTEYFRVLKPGGTVLILEIARPRSPLQYTLAKFFLRHVIPRIARYKTKQTEAQTIMEYFWDTIEHCVPPESILKSFEDSHFNQAKVSDIFGGLIRDYSAVKPQSAG